MRDIKVGDKVLVDVDFANGGYEAEVIHTAKYFSRIKADGVEWDIMTCRLTPLSNKVEENLTFSNNTEVCVLCNGNKVITIENTTVNPRLETIDCPACVGVKINY